MDLNNGAEANAFGELEFHPAALEENRRLLLRYSLADSVVGIVELRLYVRSEFEKGASEFRARISCGML